jgi:hypothetical protein
MLHTATEVNPAAFVALMATWQTQAAASGGFILHALSGKRTPAESDVDIFIHPLTPAQGRTCVNDFWVRLLRPAAYTPTSLPAIYAVEDPDNFPLAQDPSHPGAYGPNFTVFTYTNSRGKAFQLILITDPQPSDDAPVHLAIDAIHQFDLTACQVGLTWHEGAMLVVTTEGATQAIGTNGNGVTDALIERLGYTYNSLTRRYTLARRVATRTHMLRRVAARIVKYAERGFHVRHNSRTATLIRRTLPAYANMPLRDALIAEIRAPTA